MTSILFLHGWHSVPGGDANDPNTGVLIYKNGRFQQGPLLPPPPRVHAGPRQSVAT